MRQILRLALLAALLAALLLPLPARAQPGALLVFAAASLTEAMREVATGWEAQGGAKLRFSFAASSTLARQLHQGARASLFASADIAWMDWAQAQNLIAEDTRRTILANRLVLVMPRGTVRAVAIDRELDLAALLGPRGRLAIGDPATVPAGRYAREALQALGLWASVAPRLAKAENVRSALLLVERGEAPIGIVYATDALAAPGVAVAASVPPGLHTPIAYPFAVTRAGDTPQARALLAFLAGPRARVIFLRHGFRED